MRQIYNIQFFCIWPVHVCLVTGNCARLHGFFD